jgi:Domain of unknown function (DUF4252)
VKAIILSALLLCSVPVFADEDIKMPASLDHLSEIATETVDVTLDQSMLQLASRFLSKDDPDQVTAKKVISKLKGIYVRSFEFDKEGQYSKADIEAVRTQLKSSKWTRMVGVKSIKGENSEVYVEKNADQFLGLVVIAAEPKELTIVYIDGPITPEELSDLSGQMGIPEITTKSKPKPTDKSSKPKEEE